MYEWGYCPRVVKKCGWMGRVGGAHMPKIEVEEKLSVCQADAYQVVKGYFEKKDFLTKLGAKILWDDKNSCAEIQGDKFSGSFAVKEEGKGSLVCIRVSLPMLLSPFKSKVKEELTKHLKRLHT